MTVRRERPHTGYQLSLFGTIEGLHRQVFITDTCSNCVYLLDFGA
jgi:hypothetical protein